MNGAHVHCIQQYMLAAVKEMAKYKYEVTRSYHLKAAEYMKVCNNLFEKGMLYHDIIKSSNSPVLENTRQGFAYFERWHHEHSLTETGIKTLTSCERFLALFDFDRSEAKKSSSEGLPCLAVYITIRQIKYRDTRTVTILFCFQVVLDLINT